MTTSIKLKKSSVAGKSPLAGDLDYGELAINYQDGKLYYKDASNAIEAFLDSAQTTSLVRRVLLDSENAVFNNVIAGDVVLSGLQVSGITYPSADGSANQVITTDGAGNLTFST